MYRLLFEGSQADQPSVTVREPVLTIGRDGACDLPLAENGISDRHAVIERRADGFYLCDLDSATGVRVNHEPVTQHRLRSGDLIELGAVTLRFEVLHRVTGARRSRDPLQILAGLAVAIILVGQLAVLAWVFSQPRPAVVRRTKSPPPGEPANLLPPVPITAAPAATPPPRPPPPHPLNRMLRLDRVSTAVTGDSVALNIQVRTQVGERELDATATAIAIQFFIRDRDGNTLPWRTPLWLNVGGLKNFSTKLFVAHFPGTPAEFGGYVVRTYYRGQLQDVVAEPATLAASAPEPTLSLP